MKKLSIAIALAILATVYFVQEHNTDALVIENVEALSYGDAEPNVKKVSDIIETFNEETVQEPDSLDEEGHVIKWKNVVVGVVHTVTCSPTEGELICKARTDYHSKDEPNLCPNAH